ncbi:MAG: hypothetical protein K6T59_13460, partial [Bryobacteraceae bacterium]|nr:hypothetical protein [Bryobacteraceae bacterium]
METLEEQLAVLRRRIQRIDRKYASGVPHPARRRSAPSDRPLHYFPDEWMSGEVIETPLGSHFETEKLYPRYRRHGSMDLSNLSELPGDLLEALSDGAVARTRPDRWAFLDTETT